MTDFRVCAVDGCDRLGSPQVCPYDDRYHHHGCIHYDCGYPKHSVSFKDDKTWHFVCAEHYDLLRRERVAFEAANQEHRRGEARV